MDIGSSISFVTEDENWVDKLGIAALVAWIPILDLAWTGFVVEIIRNTANEDLRPLPGWNDLGEKFIRGLIAALGMLVYWLPALPAACLAFAAVFVPAVFSESRAADALAAASGGVIVLSILCIVVYAAGLSLLTPAALINFARRDRFSALLDLRSILGVVAHNPGGYFIAWIASAAVNLGVGLLTAAIWTFASAIPCVGWIVGAALGGVAAAWGGAVFAHLFGQSARRLASGAPFGAQG